MGTQDKPDFKQLLHDCYDAIYPVVRDFLQEHQNPLTFRADAKSVIGLANEVALAAADKIAKDMEQPVRQVQQSTIRPQDSVH